MLLAGMSSQTIQSFTTTLMQVHPIPIVSKCASPHGCNGSHRYLLAGALSDVLNWLAETNFRSLLAESLKRRTKGTGDWFLRGEEFRSWFGGNGKVLWVVGMRKPSRLVLGTLG
jgi:hypothetical protein